MQNQTKVILFPQPLRWRFFDYAEGESNPIEDWYSELSDEGKMMFDALLKNTSKIENHLQWGGFKFLKGDEPKKERLWQLDFIADKRQYRVLGIFGAIRKQAVVVLGAYHKGDVYAPHNAIETACKRAKALRLGREGVKTLERKINTDR